MDVKRYDYGGGMMEFDTGPYVRFDDYATLREVIRALTRALTLAVGEERAAAELEKAHKEAKDA